MLTTRPEIGYYLRTNGTAPAVVGVGAISPATATDLQRVVVGAALGYADDVTVRMDSDGTGARLSPDTRYPYRAGGALRETRAAEGADLRDAVKAAIRAAGFKPVRV